MHFTIKKEQGLGGEELITMENGTFILYKRNGTLENTSERGKNQILMGLWKKSGASNALK